MLRECFKLFLLQSRPQRPGCRWRKGSRPLETYVCFRLKFRLTPHMLFFHGWLHPGAISESTYVTFVDEIWSKWNWKLKEGKNPTGLIRVNCCLLVSLVQVQLFCEGKCNIFLYWLAVQIWFPRRLFVGRNQANYQDYSGIYNWGTCRHCISGSLYTKTPWFFYLRMALVIYLAQTFSIKVRITKRSGKQNSLLSWAVVVSWV